jgi:hypothetical protein
MPCLGRCASWTDVSERGQGGLGMKLAVRASQCCRVAGRGVGGSDAFCFR